MSCFIIAPRVGIYVTFVTIELRERRGRGGGKNKAAGGRERGLWGVSSWTGHSYGHHELIAAEAIRVRSSQQVSQRGRTDDSQAHPLARSYWQAIVAG